MKYFMILAAIVGLADIRADAQDKADCSVLSVEFQNANKELSAQYAAGLTDDSAPREANRQMRMLNERAVQQMLLDRMIVGKCPLPAQLSRESYYLSAAISCELASSSYSLAQATRRDVANAEANFKAKCDRQSWQVGASPSPKDSGGSPSGAGAINLAPQ